jgi:hypothetical protein
MRNIFILVNVCLIGLSIIYAEPTARTYIFAAMESNFSDTLIDSIAKYFDVVITHDGQRNYNPMFRDTTQVTWRRKLVGSNLYFLHLFLIFRIVIWAMME